MASSKNLGAIRKDPSMRKTSRIQKELPLCGTAIPSYAEFPREEIPKPDKKYAMPKLNSVLAMKHEIEKIESLQVRALKTEDDLSPRSKQCIQPKVTQRLNFEVHRPVFKNLVSINVNDSLLPEKTSSISKKYVIKSSKKIPAPDLSDFLDPLPPLTHVVPLPELKLEFPDYPFDAYVYYKRYCAELELKKEERPYN